MSNNNITSTKNNSSKNLNHLKLTPEKLAEWGDHRSSNTYFKSQNKDDNVPDNPQDHETNLERKNNEIHKQYEKNFHSLPFSSQGNNDSNQPVHESNPDPHLVSSNELQIEKQEDNMSLDDGFDDYLKDSEYIQNIDQNEMIPQQDYYENMNIDSNMETVDLFEGCMNHDIQRLKHNEISDQEQIFNHVSENKSNFDNSLIVTEQKDNLSKKDVTILKAMQDVMPTVEIAQENKLHDEHPLKSDTPSHDDLKSYKETCFDNKPCNPIFSNEKYNKMKQSSRLRASNPNISHFMKTVMPNKKSDFDRDMEEILCDIEAYYELVQEGQLEINQQLDYIERSLDSLNKEFNKYRAKLCELNQDFCDQVQINILKESEEWESVFDRIGSNIS
ncbi:hypothetical protein RclHR1_07010005 [Rhizophagus clarus]|uniref:Uncharacterized protein n=1 Tax=Rhizophagus clarus TaxID=94130 RepID=A0A2Z6SKD9_9GLOM|nr:hypothetical protein RclHR1_07010005 [Rhizophagus clarus]GES89495.1 hypothetical protein GLOIN_2v1528653 [Rhizophagus clarus]